VSAYIDEHRERFGVEPICEALGVSASAYYQRATGERSARAVEDERLQGVIRETHRRNYEAYGYRKMWKALLRAGETAPRCRVQRLMASAGIQGAKRRGKPWRTTISDPAAKRRPDLVDRNFTAEAPNRLWVGDFTYLRCWEARLFFAFILDVFSRMIVGWQLAANMRTDLVLDALRMALGTRPHGADFQLIAHTDAGGQYTSADYTQQLDDAKVLASVGTVGDCYDNAMAESFVDTYKTELIADRVWRTRAQLEIATIEWVGWYNHDRLHEALGDIPPVEFEAATAPDAPISANEAVASIAPRPANGLTTRRSSAIGVDLGANSPLDAVNAPAARSQPNAPSPTEALLTMNAAGGCTTPPGSSPTYGSRETDWLTTSTT
jgi:putative transposase